MSKQRDVYAEDGRLVGHIVDDGRSVLASGVDAATNRHAKRSFAEGKSMAGARRRAANWLRKRHEDAQRSQRIAEAWRNHDRRVASGADISYKLASRNIPNA